MKTITVNWTDAELNDHQFVMDVDEHQNIDSLVKEKVFDEAVANYEWNGASDLIVVTQKQARVMAQLIKDISTTSYATGYSQGKADQAYEDGFKAGKDQQ